MRVLSILTNFTFLTVVQQLISIWFLFDFFLARDSSTVNSLWKPAPDNDHLFEEVQLLSRQVKIKHCPDEVLAKPLIDKIIFIVIDALGSDFIPSIKINAEQNHVAMPFLEQSLREHKALGFEARAATPTVTMPRIKALLSGTIPSFIDILYNLAADVSHFEEDNILRIAKARNKNLVFYGDDTWLSLFDKNIFTRYKETLSFYANDYTSVDTNVTLAALPETTLQHVDWDYLILHYLGLDHIGHVFGSNKAPLIEKKLQEMDAVIRSIHKNMSLKEHRTLIVICGDHGMSQEGNHGGDSNLEAQTAMIFLPIGQKLARVVIPQAPVQQIDMATTLSILTGMPIPKMSRGVAIETLLHSLFPPEDARLPCASFENMLELVNLTSSRILKSNETYLDIIKLLSDILESRVNFSTSAQNFSKSSREIQSRLLETIVANSNPIIIISVLAFVTLLSLISIRRTSIRLLLPALAKLERLFCIISLIVPIVMHGSTDFIELEHRFWPLYSLTTFTIFTSLAIQSQPTSRRNLDTLKVVLFFITYVLTFLWNHLKFGDGSYRSNPFFYMFALAILSNFIRQNSEIKKFKGQLAILIGALIMVSNHTEEPSELDALTSVDHRILVQRIALLFVLIHTALNIISGGKGQSLSSLISKLASGWISFAFLLSRSHNFLFFAANIIMETSLNSIANSLKFSTMTRIILYINFAQASFYNQGNSNLFTSIDVKPAFYAQDSYNLTLSVPLVAAATFSAQIYWYLKMFQRNQVHEKAFQANILQASQPEIPVRAVSEFVIVRNFLSLSYFMFVCIILRNHLFVWSVLSPKLVYHTVSNFVLLLTTLEISYLQLVLEDKSAKREVKEIRQ